MLALLVAFLPLGNAFFFGGSSCGCGAPPACPPTPVCAPALPSACPQQSACGGGGYAQAPLAPLASLVTAPNVFQQPQGFAPLVPQAPLSFGQPQPMFQPQAVSQPLAGGSYQSAPVQASVQQQQQPIVPAGGYQEAPQAPIQASVQPAQQTQENYQGAAAEVQPAAEEVQETSNYREDGNHAEISAAAAASKNAEVIEEAVEKSKSEGKTEKVEGKEQKGEDKVIDISQLKLSDDPLCNSDELRNLMIENMDDNLNSSKRLIQLAAEAHFGGRFDVICANGDFSYVTNTELYCQETKGDVSCYTYRQL